MVYLFSVGGTPFFQRRSLLFKRFKANDRQLKPRFPQLPVILYFYESIKHGFLYNLISLTFSNDAGLFIAL